MNHVIRFGSKEQKKAVKNLFNFTVYIDWLLLSSIKTFEQLFAFLFALLVLSDCLQDCSSLVNPNKVNLITYLICSHQAALHEYHTNLVL